MKHVLWDWNGTLLDDTQAALDTLNLTDAQATVKTELNVPWSLATESAFSGSAHQTPSTTNLYW